MVEFFDGKTWRSRSCKNAEDTCRRSSALRPQLNPSGLQQVDVEFVAGTRPEMIENLFAQGDLPLESHCERDGHSANSIEFDLQIVR